VPFQNGLGIRLRLHATHFVDKLRMRAVARLNPGIEMDPTTSPNFWMARYNLAPGARLRLGPGVTTDRRRGAVTFLLEEGAVIEIEEGTWLRTEVAPVVLAAYAGARMRIGPDSLLNGCHLSAKAEVSLGRRVWIGPGSRVFDSDQHDLDADHPEVPDPVRIDDHAWVASDTTVLRGVRIGAHSVIGARSLVTGDIPEHTLAYGIPARPHGEVGDRTHTG
jgi:carbonic anhydrase/acetyltransferase-like protein (isoleucine patch superfamily)